MQNRNLLQALEMSLYFWAAAAAVGVLVLLIISCLCKTERQKIDMLTLVAMLTGVYTSVTCMLWFYYFSLVFCLPFFVLLLILTFWLLRIAPKERGIKIVIGFVLTTIILGILSANFFGMI